MVFHYKPSILEYPYCWKRPSCFGRQELGKLEELYRQLLEEQDAEHRKQDGKGGVLGGSPQSVSG